MAERLQAVFEASDPLQTVYGSSRLVAHLEAALADAGGGQDRTVLLRRYADALLDVGRSEEALAAFIRLEQHLEATRPTLTPNFMLGLLCSKAVCHLRIGEQENCLHNHNADSCLLPIRGGGVHLAPRGSRGATEVLGTVLARYPGDLRARWLMNIASMTLGEYPHGLAPEVVIPPAVFESEYPLPRFPDIAAAVGLVDNDLAGGVVMEDFDNDGLLDLMISGWGLQSQTRVFRNVGDGTFTERTREAGLTGLVSGLNLIHADYNNDGFEDVLVLRGAWLGPQGKYPNSLLRNNGDFTFTDVTEEAGLLSFHPTQTAVWFDFDGDGHLDLFIGNESRDDRDPNACELYRNNGDGTFAECSVPHGLAVIDFIKGVAAGDYNNDGRPDLFLSSRNGTRRLYRNDGPADECTPAPRWVFTEVAQASGVGARHRSFPCWFWDYNNDGWEDLMVTGYAIQDVGDVAADYLGVPSTGERARLFRNRGDGTFADVSEEAGVSRVLHAMGVNFGDLDNDGWLDFYAGTGDPDYSTLMPNRMFRNAGGHRFQDVTTAGGFGQLQKGHGIAFGDLDNDGDQDVYSVVGGALAGDTYPNQLFANPGSAHAWLKLKLVGTRSNRSAIGARVRVTVRSENGTRRIYRTVGSGASFGSSTLRCEIGLGAPDAVIERVDVLWPGSGMRQAFTGLEANRMYRLTEGDMEVAPVDLPRFSLPHEGGVHSHRHQHAALPLP